MVQSSKKGKTSNINLIQPLTLVEFEADPRENIQIHQLKDLRMSHPLHHIHFDPVKSAIVMFLDEVLYKTIPDDYDENQREGVDRGGRGVGAGKKGRLERCRWRRNARASGPRQAEVGASASVGLTPGQGITAGTRGTGG